MIGRKVFDLNGSPHVKNRTCTTPQEIEKLFHQEGLQTMGPLPPQHARSSAMSEIGQDSAADAGKGSPDFDPFHWPSPLKKNLDVQIFLLMPVISLSDG